MNQTNNIRQLSENEAKMMIMGALLYAHGADVAFNDEALVAAWDCYKDALSLGKGVENALNDCVACINVDAFVSKDR
jgi:hypothetical protein